MVIKSRFTRWVMRFYAEERRAAMRGVPPFYITDGGVMYAKSSEVLSSKAVLRQLKQLEALEISLKK